MDTKIIQAKAQEINAQEMLRQIEDGVLYELTGLYGDIRIELFLKAPDSETPLIDVYSDLLAKEQSIFDPETAFQEGREAAQSERECNPVEYMTKFYSTPENQRLRREFDNTFYSLCNLLGDTRGLINEYTEAYRLFYGAINRKIDLFYQWGYYGKIQDEAEKAG